MNEIENTSYTKKRKEEDMLESSEELEEMKKKPRVNETKVKEVKKNKTKKSQEEKALECIINIVKVISQSKLKEKLESSFHEDSESAARSSEESEISVKESHIPEFLDKSIDIAMKSEHMCLNIQESQKESESASKEECEKIPIKNETISDDIVKNVSIACFRRLRHVLRNALNRTIESARQVLTSDDFRAGCKYYDFEHPYCNSSGSHLLEILRKDAEKRKSEL